MSAIQSKQEGFSADKGETRGSWAARIMGKSAGTTLIELGITLARAEPATAMPGWCFRCRGRQDPRRSTAQYPSAFCSEHCEQEFVRAALASLTLQDCIRIHQRLEDLLVGVQDRHV
jgi:hypothetical protein